MSNIKIGDRNKIKKSQIGDTTISNDKRERKHCFINWFLKHLESIIVGVITGILVGITMYFITKYCFK